MKYILPALLSVFLFTGCKKKEEPKYTTMSVEVSGASTKKWTSTEVSSFGSDNALSISCIDPVSRDRVKLAIYGYREGRRTYAISFNDLGENQGGNVAVYEYGNSAYISSTGSISITRYTTKTIDGTFTFTGTGGHVTGTFKAPLP